MIQSRETSPVVLVVHIVPDLTCTTLDGIDIANGSLSQDSDFERFRGVQTDYIVPPVIQPSSAA